MPIRLPDPFTHPNHAPGFLSAPLVDNEPVIQDALPNGQVLEVTTSSQYWSINITYPELLKTEYDLISSTVFGAKADDGIIQVMLPQYMSNSVVGDLSSTTIPAGQVGSVLRVTNYPRALGLPLIGDLFQIDSLPKVYKITSVVHDLATNMLTLGIYPKLAATTTGLQKPKFNDILFNMKLINRTSFTESLNADGLYDDVSLALREAL